MYVEVKILRRLLCDYTEQSSLEDLIVTNYLGLPQTCIVVLCGFESQPDDQA